MADAVSSPSDRDLVSIAEARALARRAKQAWLELAEFSQEKIDTIVGAAAAAATGQAEALARLAVDETGFGVYEDKIQKNLFASQKVFNFIQPMKTVGVIARHEDRRVIEIAEPFGVVAAIVPSTNPTSTAIYKILIALKARCTIVISPHPSAAKCIIRTAEVMDDAARRAGAPAGTINWMTTVSLEGTQELMKQRDVAVILATGGMGLVRAAYSAGKPAYGVGPGNAPAYIERTADVRKAVRDIITGKTFDNGVLCSSENSVVVDAPIAEQVKREFQAQGGHFLSRADIDRVAKVLVTPQRLPNPALVGKSAKIIADACGVTVADDTRVLIAELEGVGRDYPLSIEKLCPLLSFYVVSDWREGCERCKQILRYGGMGHTMGIHSQNEQVILEFGLKKPAFRIAVNTPTTFGSTGISTGLDPAMTLGCGGFGGNITSDNITPRHLLNIKRVAYETVAVPNRFERAAGSTPATLPVSPVRPPAAEGIRADVLNQRIDQFLGTRGFKEASASSATGNTSGAAATPASERPLDFVCEDDVRLAMRDGRKLVVSERAILTPSARELGEAHRIFTFV
ncbi:MAG TPA: aldehyde dehydrogenase family protein [Vicinamibacterales bacterium]|nr:aldehyde dehydrogenase family protein [Vicinamibacterales bacterium]